MKKQYLIAHDLGTSGDKASLFSIDGELVRSHTENYDVHFFHGGCAEQNPIDWWNAFCRANKKITDGIDPNQVLAISFSAQMQCCLVVDKNGEPLRPAIIWADHRAVRQEQQLRERIGADKMYRLTGHRVSASYSLEKLMWIRENEPEIYAKTYKMLQAKDYLIYKLTNRFVTDHSDASGTDAFDLEKNCWSEEIIQASEVSMDIFPELKKSVDIVGSLTGEAAAALGLHTGVKVVCGGGDGPCSALGAGCIGGDEMFLSYGTSAWIAGTSDEVFMDSNQILICFAHVIPGKYVPCGTMQAAGSSYAYMKKTFYDADVTYDRLNEAIAASPAGAKGLLFLPYMLGERSPRWNPNTSGSFLGMRMEHDRNDYLRATIEGVAMNLELILKAQREHFSTNTLTFTGGGAKGRIVAQILADILQVTMNRLDHVEEATSIAAAVLAGVGVGVFSDCSEVKRFVKIQDTTEYNKENAAVYDRQKKIFDAAYYALKPVYEMMEGK